MPLEGLDTSQPAETAPLPADGRIQLRRVLETVALTEKSIPFTTRTELSADVDLDQQSLLQGGETGLAIARTRIRLQDGVEISRQAESETIVRPPQDRVIGYGSRIVIKTTTVDGVTFQYWRAVTVYATSYSPCRSAGVAGKCYYYTSNRTPVQKGEIGMVYSWYLLFGSQPVYIPGYGNATVEDVGGGAPAGNHYWVDLGYSDNDFVEWGQWVTLYFLLPVQEPNPGYILP
jgi:resuscitation-promoting factor RpfB